MNNDFVSIIIPAYNEAENIEGLLEKITKSFNDSKYQDRYETIIVNDGSTDEIENICKNVLKKNFKFRLINLKENIGKAYAVETGILYSKGNYISIIDSDLQYNPKNLIDMLEMSEKGYSMINGNRAKRKDDKVTKYFSKIYNLLINFFFNINCKDLFSGIKVFKREIYDLMEYNGLVRFVIFFSKKYKFKISEINVDHNNRFKGKTKYNFLQRIILSCKDIFTLIVCILMNKEKIYQIKQLILIFYFIMFCYLIFDAIQNKVIDLNKTYLVILSFALLTILNFITNSFLGKKDKRNIDLKNNIKSIFTN